jgi:hypothetical protein
MSGCGSGANSGFWGGFAGSAGDKTAISVKSICISFVGEFQEIASPSPASPAFFALKVKVQVPTRSFRIQLL